MKRALLSFFLIIGVFSILLVASYRAMNTPMSSNDVSVGNIPVTNTTNSSTVVVPPEVTLPKLATPSGVTVVAVSSTSAKLTWSPVTATTADAVVYIVWRNGQKVATVTRTEFLDVFLLPGQSLTYAITSATTSGAVSEPTAIARVTLPTSSQVVVVPTKPTTGGTKNTNTSTPPKNTNTTPTTNKNTSTGGGTPTNTNTSTGGGTNTTNTVVTPPPPPAACGSGGSCTAADVAKHATKSNCWVYLSPINKVYNVTSYVSGSSHPGGNVIAQYCGQNIYSYFIGSAGGHAHSNRALNTTLAAYYLGVFQP